MRWLKPVFKAFNPNKHDGTPKPEGCSEAAKAVAYRAAEAVNKRKDYL